MKEIDFLDAVGRVDKQYIEECITYKPPKKMNVWIKSMSAIAACFVLVIAVVLAVNHLNQPVIIDENGFYIEDGVLLRYTGSETDVTIPETVETIADFTFLENTNANKIEVVRLGTSVQKVETNAFAGLENLVDLIIAENNLSFVYEDGLIMTSDGSILLRYEREGETSFTIPDTVRFVAAHAVQGTELEEIDFGENLEYIGYNSFASNDKLKAIYLPDSLKYISEGAFGGCMSAVDGYIPSGVQFGGEAFFGVPFYLTMQAGQMSPLEERMRGLVTPSEEIVKSDLAILESQIYYTLAALRGEEVTPTDEATRRAYAVGTNAPEIPDGMVIPSEFSLSDLTYTDGTGIYNVLIYIPAGEYTLVLQAQPENLPTALCWEDVIYRVLSLFYLQNPAVAAPEDTVTAFGWTAVFGHEDGLYCGITYTHEDGTVIRSHLPEPSTTPYKLTFSPNGTRVAVEYTLDTRPGFYIQSLNGDKLLWDDSDYNQYLNKYNGQYVADTLKWADEDNIEGDNIYGRFRYNIYGFEAIRIKEEGTPVEVDDVTRLLSMTVAELRESYGKMHLEYFEYEWGQPVYSFANLPGVLAAFDFLDMHTPPGDDFFPSEIILTEEYGKSVHGLVVGPTSSEDAAKIPWFDAWYSVINGTAHARAAFDTYTVTAVFSGKFTDLPNEETATEQEWDVWAEKFMKSPTGNIGQIRLKPIPALSEQQDSLPDSAEDARLKYKLIGGSPIVYVFEDDLTFYMHYLSPSGNDKYYRCSPLLPEGYTNGRIVFVEGAGGSGEFHLYIEAQRNGTKEILAYLYVCEGSPVELWYRTRVEDDERLAYIESQIK